MFVLKICARRNLWEMKPSLRTAGAWGQEMLSLLSMKTHDVRWVHHICEFEQREMAASRARRVFMLLACCCWRARVSLNMSPARLFIYDAIGDGWFFVVRNAARSCPSACLHYYYIPIFTMKFSRAACLFGLFIMAKRFVHALFVTMMPTIAAVNSLFLSVYYVCCCLLLLSPVCLSINDVFSRHTMFVTSCFVCSIRPTGLFGLFICWTMMPVVWLETTNIGEHH